MKHLAFATLLLGLLSACGNLCPESFTTGVFLPAGSRMHALEGGHGKLYSMYGAERISGSELKDIALFHVLVLLPAVELRGSGHHSSANCLWGTETMSWQLGSGPTGTSDLTERTLKLSYDGRQKLLTIGAQSLPTTESNTFIVRLDSAWQPTVTRVDLLIRERMEPRDLMARIRQAEVNTEDVRDLRLYDEAEAQR